MNGRPWTAEEKARLAALRRRGVTFTECQRLLGRTRLSINGMVDVLGLRVRRIRPWTMKDLLEADRLRRAGVGYAAIGARLGRTGCGVRQQLLKRGRTPRKRFIPRERLRELFAAGCSDADAAGELGFTPRAVRCARWRMGLKYTPEQARERMRADAWKGPAAAGLACLNEASVAACRRRANALFPGAPTVFAARLLWALAGPMTLTDLARALGARPNYGWVWKVAPRLLALGMIEKAPPPVGRRLRGGPVFYRRSAAAERTARTHYPRKEASA